MIQAREITKGTFLKQSKIGMNRQELIDWNPVSKSQHISVFGPTQMLGTDKYWQYIGLGSPGSCS